MWCNFTKTPHVLQVPAIFWFSIVWTWWPRSVAFPWTTHRACISVSVSFRGIRVCSWRFRKMPSRLPLMLLWGIRPLLRFPWRGRIRLRRRTVSNHYWRVTLASVVFVPAEFSGGWNFMMDVPWPRRLRGWRWCRVYFRVWTNVIVIHNRLSTGLIIHRVSFFRSLFPFGFLLLYFLFPTATWVTVTVFLAYVSRVTRIPWLFVVVVCHHVTIWSCIILSKICRIACRRLARHFIFFRQCSLSCGYPWRNLELPPPE